MEFFEIDCLLYSSIIKVYLLKRLLKIFFKSELPISHKNAFERTYKINIITKKNGIYKIKCNPSICQVSKLQFQTNLFNFRIIKKQIPNSKTKNVKLVKIEPRSITKAERTQAVIPNDPASYTPPN